jgi:hypothetical protein
MDPKKFAYVNMVRAGFVVLAYDPMTGRTAPILIRARPY